MSAITIDVPDSLFGKLKEMTAKDQSTPQLFARCRCLAFAAIA